MFQKSFNIFLVVWMFRQEFYHFFLKFLIRKFSSGDTEYGKFFREKVLSVKFVQCRYQFSFRQVA